MIPTGNHRRPWVVRDARIPNVVVPARNFKPYEAPDFSLWREARRFAFDAISSDSAGAIAVLIAMFSFVLLLLHL